MTLQAVLFKEGSQWVAVCLEHFVASQGSTREKAKEMLVLQLRAQNKTRTKVKSISPAPSSYRTKGTRYTVTF